MGTQLDWVQAQLKKEHKLQLLRDTLAKEIHRELPHTESSINITLMMIERTCGTEAEQQTRAMFGLTEQIQA